MTASTSSNPYISHTINNIDLIIILNNERKDWTRKYYKIIRGLETMVNIQLQLQNIIQLAKVTNTQLAEVEITILQVSDMYKIQTREDIFSISEELQNIIQGEIEKQAYHIQVLLADKLNQCKCKKNKRIEKYIKMIQEAYQETHQEVLQPIDIDKGKQKEGIV